jgi:hypothetical protein
MRTLPPTDCDPYREDDESRVMCDLCDYEAAAVVEDYGERRIAACRGCAGRLLRLGARAVASHARCGKADDERQWQGFMSLAQVYWDEIGRSSSAEFGRLMDWLQTFPGWGDADGQSDAGVTPRRGLIARLYGNRNRRDASASRRQPEPKDRPPEDVAE